MYSILCSFIKKNIHSMSQESFLEFRKILFLVDLGINSRQSRFYTEVSTPLIVNVKNKRETRSKYTKFKI